MVPTTGAGFAWWRRPIGRSASLTWRPGESRSLLQRPAGRREAAGALPLLVEQLLDRDQKLDERQHRPRRRQHRERPRRVLEDDVAQGRRPGKEVSRRQRQPDGGLGWSRV